MDDKYFQETNEEALTLWLPVIKMGVKDMPECNEALDMATKALKHESKTEHCKDCKWWKDSDGVYRRGAHAKSQCPINRREVFEGNGYCYMFEPYKKGDK